ncbi:MAG: oligosaccharide flippase family protein [Actinobacteria bacterium]|nr:oligosaccharide flippase family protein [Actinomycetota bacterium]
MPSSVPMVNKLRAALDRAAPPGSLRARFARGSAWSLGGQIASYVVGVISAALVGRALGRAGFGELGMIQSTVGMFGLLAGMGLGVTNTKFVAELRSSHPRRAGRIMGLSLVVSIVSGAVVCGLVIGLAPLLAGRTLDDPSLTVPLQIAAALLLFESVIGALSGALAGFEAFREIALNTTLRVLLTFPLIVLGAYYLGLTGATLGLAGGALIGLVLYVISAVRVSRRHQCTACFDGLRTELRVLTGFSLPAYVSGAMVTPMIWLARLLLFRYPNGPEQMGLFQATWRFQDIISLLGATVGASLLPLLASREGSGSKRLASGNMLVSWALGFFILAPLMAFPEVVGVLFGGGYAGRPLNVTMVLTMAVTNIVLYKQGLARVLTARALLWWGVLSNGVWAVTLLLCTWWLAPHGAMGLAGAFLIAYAVNVAVFIPLYTGKRLVPRSTIVSWEALGIWLLLAALAAGSLVEVTWALRAILLLACLGAGGGLFWRMARPAH